MSNTKSVIIGLADVRIAPYADYVGIYTPALSSANSIGFQTETSFTKSSEPITIGKSLNGAIYEEVIGYKNHSLIVSATINNLNNWSIQNMLGITTGASPSGCPPSDASFQITPEDLLALRVEVVGNYCGGEKRLILIIPKATIQIGMDVSFSVGGVASNHITIHAQPLINSTWSSDPLGRLLIESA
jgi:hypothetical protein